ncbi:hypothetical protein HYH02_010783 [Chlamydomonas schloesseri]|uniref:Poly(A) RNA polymerase mitochondrial-like central palm domain-containing protein n=1 Tax=Chlamydomonas schloesseri TaxID=2026947 RepID=A0A835T8G9_9CHLO|nr:hypothetical protein HYH02_010783 [Chlamydomonas schloesseri]|eukprot:KAG2438992.1 hypothetical protein HYH02_010783 [Chlamydomonas schloesseri]
MLPAAAALHASAMVPSSAAAAPARLTCPGPVRSPASVRAPTSASPSQLGSSVLARAPAQPGASWQPQAEMLPGLLRLRSGASARSRAIAPGAECCTALWGEPGRSSSGAAAAAAASSSIDCDSNICCSTSSASAPAVGLGSARLPRSVGAWLGDHSYAMPRRAVAAAAAPGSSSRASLTPLVSSLVAVSAAPSGLPGSSLVPRPGAGLRALATSVRAGAAPEQQPMSKKQQKAAAAAAKQAAAAAAQAGGSNGQGVEAEDGGSAAPAAPPQPSVRYSPLHYNIEEFCQRVVPTEGERRQRQDVIEAVRGGVRRVWPGARGVELQVFGSFANGLSTWNSDLDLVVTGIYEPDRMTGGYEINDRGRITAKLRKIAEALNRSKAIDIERQQLIPRARIPILKLWTKARVTVDVSMSDDSGPRAARYMAQQCRAYPPLKPLVLVLKAYLKACRLNEVNTGGLSSYSLTNMVIAHLQEELKSGHDISDLGETLYTFLLRYGEEHDYSSQAVSVASGGIVPKMSLGFAMESARQAAVTMGSYDGAVSWNERLCVDCPLTGRDVSNGTFRIDLVRGAFVQAARKLEALARGRRISDTSLNYLQALFDVQRVLKRQYDPYEPYEDEYLKVIRNSDDEDMPEEDMLIGGGAGGDDEDDDDLDGDYMERRSPAPATPSSQQSGRRR